ncbi:sensor histidine kinase [Paenibacillus sp. N4]|uniref:sensor histidine kinase n=1 Tax=Paenibacillus vietnamensis TaxID=2590547 RepID=UPI001CD18DB2|nr:sensor histidine kinase [Paenibacillus vietnamensis]MCA0755049.1 sensor histidine kinase [Paenibacillus vietnamensis]
MHKMPGYPVKHGRIAVRSLRRTLVIYLMLGCLLPLVLVGILTYSSIYSILSNKIKGGISATLMQEAANLENAVINLDLASKQFALDDQISNEVSDYLSLKDNQLYNKAQIMASIKEKMNLATFTNPYLGLTAYLELGEPGNAESVLFTNLNIGKTFSSSTLPEFIRYNGADYFGPHPTQYGSRSSLVLSAMRAVSDPGNRPLFIYMETHYSLIDNILNKQSYGMKVSHVLVNGNNQTVYVEDPELPQNIRDAISQNKIGDYQFLSSRHLFRYASSQGWQLIGVVHNSTFNSEIVDWLRNMILVALSTLVFAVLLAWLIWRHINRPLRKVNVEIVRMVENRSSQVSYTNVQEFNFVLENFQEMKDQINRMIHTVETNEKEKGRFEVEKLLSQINPHFLHNTLNTVQWLARMNGQQDIDKLVTLLIKVLHYNLGKKSLIVTVADEIDALRNYMDLQRIRYDCEFHYSLDSDDEALHVAVPRFLLQPLVENAIYHGTGDQGGKVAVTIRIKDDSWVTLRVEDNGTGMDQETADRLLTDDEAGRKRGLGIGLSYVHRMLKRYYGDQMKLGIVSEQNVGTVITIQIPIRRMEEFDD